IHITQGDQVGRAIIISWVTVDEPGSNTVVYWPENTKHKHSAEGTVLTYKYTNYISGWFDTKYFYEVGLGLTTQQFLFTTPPQIGSDVPYTFGLMVLVSTFIQGILVRLIIQIEHSLIMNQSLQKDKRCCSLVKNLMQIIIHCMTYAGRIHGGDSLSEVLLINLGYGLPEIMSLIFFPNLCELAI
ncbi:hypothetical protein GIB67_004993, partial [Kingdonia uniflora]